MTARLRAHALLALGLAGLAGGVAMPAAADSTSETTSTRKTPASPNIPPQCYTRTEDKQGNVYNPCYVCHVDGEAPNFVQDAVTQLDYALPGPALENHWANLFVDRRDAVAAQGDADMDAYVAQDNYPALRHALRDFPAAWADYDANDNGRWDGFLPDCEYRFDNRGFDRRADGSLTGWRAFAYYPLPGGFMPTNGATDDVLIRLPAWFRRTRDGAEDADTYAVNLAILEALITRKDVPMAPVDETRWGVDLNRDGQLGTADRVAFVWPPEAGAPPVMEWVGEAGALQGAGKVHLAAGLYPVDTEFLHSVRYLGLDENEQVVMPLRMKELRYGRKVGWHDYANLAMIEQRAESEAIAFPDRIELYAGDAEQGLYNGRGWVFQGFIENAEGALRPQSREETKFCLGCHTGLGVITDGTFALPRKLDAADSFQRGWYHWRDKGLAGLPEPKGPNGGWEYTTYLQRNHAGNEFRANEEVKRTFFTADGTLKPAMVERLHQDIGMLLLPTAERARTLNKAYRTIVREQSYLWGRDPNVRPMTDTVWREVTQDQPTGIDPAEERP